MSRYRQSFNEALAQVEKWSKDVEVKSTGEHAGKTIAQLKKEVDALRGKPNNEKEMGGLLFAIRAKQGWKKGEGSTGVGEATQIKHERGEVKPEKAERGERKAGESEDDYENRESGGAKGFRPDPFKKKKKKQDDLDRDDEAQATRSKVRPTAEHKTKIDHEHPHNPVNDDPDSGNEDYGEVEGWVELEDEEPKSESKLPPHLAKFFDKKANPNKEAQARMDAGKKKREVAAKVKDVTPKGYGPSEEVEKEAPRELKITQKGLDALRAARDKPKEKSTKLRLTKKGREAIKDEVEKEALDTWHPDPEKDRKTTSMKHTAKSVAHQAAQKKKPATFATIDTRQAAAKVQDILRKQRERKAAAKKEETEIGENLEFKVKIKGIPSFYVPAKTAAKVKQSLRKQLKHPDDIESITRVTKAAQKIDFRLRAQGKGEKEEDNKK